MLDAPQDVDALAAAIADDLPVGVWAARVPTGELLYANKMFGEIMGMSARTDVAVGAYAAPYSIHDREGALYPEAKMPFVRAMTERCIVTIDDIVIHRADGAHVNIRAQARPVIDASGVMTHVIVAFIDITREVTAERARDAFLSVAAHELRTPIATLSLRMHFIRQLLTVGEEIAGDRLSTWLSACERQARRLARLSEQLLDVSRIKGGRFAADLEEGDLSLMVRRAVASFQELDSGPGCEIHVETGGELHLRFDPIRLEHVLTNLISNAVKYGRGRPVTLRVARDGDRAIIAVADQGIGVAAEDHARIFEPFERAVSERNYGGLGLGLWIARQSVESMGGMLRVESEPDAGATFFIELPCDR